MTMTVERTSVTLHLAAGMVGFPESTDFSLSEIEPGVYEMLSLSSDDFGFVVVDPDNYFPDYNPSIGRDLAERLGLGKPEDAQLLAVVNVGDETEPPVANLMAPIVINKATCEAMQVVLADQDFPLRAKMPTK